MPSELPTDNSRRSVLAGASAMLIAGAAPRSAWDKTEADVVVIGAGLSGLNAALILEAAGLKVIVVEAEPRIGGRLHTLDDLPGRPEAGAIQIGQGYHRMEALAARFDIALVPSGADSRDILYRINGHTLAGRDWVSSPANHLVGAERAISPAGLQPYYWPKLPSLAAPDAWLTADMGRFDMSYGDALAAAGASDEARRLIAANLNGNGLASLSLLSVARTLAIFRARAGPVRLIAGGSQRLPEAMAAGLKKPPALRQIVRGISLSKEGVAVALKGGKTIHARHALCTIPFAAMQGIKIEGQLPPAIRKAIATTRYTHASFAYFAARTPFWKQDGLPETLWSDEAMIGRVFVLGEDPPMLKVWITGVHADALDAMPDAVAGVAIIAAIATARPSSRGQLRLLRRYSWQRSPFARGIYHHIGTGTGRILAGAVRSEGTRLHFAGEHLARGGSGIEGALESGERAAARIASLAG